MWKIAGKSSKVDQNAPFPPIDENGKPVLENDLKNSNPKLKCSGVSRFLLVSLIPVENHENYKDNEQDERFLKTKYLL